jgi:phenylacetate-CoA ligase
MAMEKTKEILQYQIIQRKLNEFEIKIVLDAQLKDKIKDKIKDNLKKVLGKNAKINVNLCAQIPREKSGKYRVVKCELK